MAVRVANRYKVEGFKILSVTIHEEGNSKLLKTLKPGRYPFYDQGISEDFFAHNVNVSAIVGKNGAGKSSLLDIMFRMVNNFSAYLVGNSMKRRSADVIYYIPGIYAELHYQMDDKKGVLYNYDDVVALSFGEKKYLLSDHKLMKDSRFDDFEHCYRPSSLKRREMAKCFFYTVVMNYALQAYNSSDYHYASYAFFGDLDMIDGKLRDAVDREKLKILIKEILVDKSHITTKIRQTLLFLKNFKTMSFQNVDFDYSYYKKWLRKKKNDSSLEATMELLPPPIFDSKIYLRRQNGQEEIPFYKLSSGERQFLFMMSSIIYHVVNIKSVPTNRVAYRYLNIVLDEVEMCFHPEYQRTFIYNLLNAIDRLHLNTYCSFNIIITTHSPFLLSDIPQSNVLYLENGEVVDKSEMQNPFAANVNDILYQSFFLSNGFMGEFAKQKIIKMINEVNNNKFDKQKALELVDLVGEPILKERLKDLIEESLQ